MLTEMVEVKMNENYCCKLNVELLDVGGVDGDGVSLFYSSLSCHTVILCDLPLLLLNHHHHHTVHKM